MTEQNQNHPANNQTAKGSRKIFLGIFVLVVLVGLLFVFLKLSGKEEMMKQVAKKPEVFLGEGEGLVPLYRCNQRYENPSWHNHFLSFDENCEDNAAVDSVNQIGYVYANHTQPDGTVPLYRCFQKYENTAFPFHNHFSSLDENCEDNAAVDSVNRIGYIYPNHTHPDDAVPLYRCNQRYENPSWHNHFLSRDENCEDADNLYNSFKIGYIYANIPDPDDDCIPEGGIGEY